MSPTLVKLLEEPRAPDPPPRFWLDWLLVVGFGLGAVVELSLRTDVTLPVLSLTWTGLAILGVHIRRWQPLTAVLLAFGTGVPVNLLIWWLAIPWQGLYATACAMLLPYTLLRWGSGREAAIGIAVILVGWTIEVATDFVSVTLTCRH